ncbi:MAG: hypothetical protein AB2L14_28870 [Candidatus Xenobiia bacterium LiM19]
MAEFNPGENLSEQKGGELSERYRGDRKANYFPFTILFFHLRLKKQLLAFIPLYALHFTVILQPDVKHMKRRD